MKRGSMFLGLLLPALFATWIAHPPAASARLWPDRDARENLRGEHLLARGTYPSGPDPSQSEVWPWENNPKSGSAHVGTWDDPWNDVQTPNYVASDLDAFNAIMSAGLGSATGSGCWFTQRLPINNKNLGHADDMVNGLHDLSWSGQCLGYVSLLLLRSGAVDSNPRHILISYGELEEATRARSVGWNEVTTGDILYRTGNDEHAMIFLYAAFNGFIVGDSNYGSNLTEEHIRTRYIAWNSNEQKGFHIADLNTLIGQLMKG